MNRFTRIAANLALVLGFVIWSAPGTSADAPKPAAEEGRDVDVALCLDVSGSMQGLITSAKNKLWDIVNELAKAKPTPRLRVALYSYGHSTYDAKKGWVRKELDLTTDLDMLYQKLFALTINGGDEYVGRVSRDAVVEQKWSEEKNALKLIFVAGNEPASQDPLVSMKQAAEIAKGKGILINPIYCGGSDDGDASSWRELAGLSGGRFASINQNQQIAINTPVDKDLAKLANELNATYVAYGKSQWKGANQATQTANSAQFGPANLAARVQAQNSVFYNCEDWDLVDKCKKDAKFDITKVPVDDLSEVMKNMTPEQRVAHVKEMTEKRAKLQKQIDELSVRRNDYIRDEMKRNPNPAAQAFDQALRQTLRIQAEAKGLKIPE
ncbi:MAG: VWA domain-containing protein [Gemmataceae bacterium]|nr:VWA domain-containing protein [Gemmataceae bacterium]